MAGIPVAPVQKIVDELTALINGEPPPPPSNKTILEGSGESITDAGHTWTLGAHVDQRGAIVLRDGLQYGSGVAHKLVLSANIIWAEALPGVWYKDNGSYWIGGGTGPTP